MADSLDLRLRVRVNADGSAQVLGGVGREIRQVGQQAAASNAQVRSFGDSVHSAATQALDLRGALYASAAGFSVVALVASAKNLIDYADSLKLIDARVKVATQSAADYALANQALLAVSLETHSSLAENANLFARTNKAIEQMGGSIGNTIAFTDLLAKSLKISGASQEETASVTRQMSQAFASGVLRGDEFNSIMENGSRLAFVLADGLGVGVGELRKMAEAGELTAPKVLQATLSQAEKINSEFKTLPVTVAAAMTDVETQFGRYINAANAANGTTSSLAAGIGVLAQNLPAVLDVLILLGEAAVLALVSKGVSSLIAYTQATIAARQAAALHAEITTAHSQALVMDAQRTVTATTATVANTQAEIAATQARLAGTLSMGERMAVTNTLNLQTTALTAATQAQTAAQTQLSAVIAANTPNITTLSVAMGALNVAMVGVMAYQFGTWLASIPDVAIKAAEATGFLAHSFLYLSTVGQVVLSVTSGHLRDIPGIIKAYDEQGRVIEMTTSAMVEHQEALKKSGGATEELRNYLLQIKSPLDAYMIGVDKANKALAVAPDLVNNYRQELVRLRNEFERATELQQSPFHKAMTELQDELDKLRKTELDYRTDKTIREKGVVNEDEKKHIRETIALIIQERDEKQAAQQAINEQKKRDHEEEKNQIKAIEQAHKAAADAQISEIKRVAQARLFANDEALAQLEFDYQQNNVGLASFLAQKTELIKQATALEIEQLEQQKQSVETYAGDIEKAIAALRKIESSNNPYAISTTEDGRHAIGAMQTLPSTLKGYGVAMGGLTDKSSREDLLRWLKTANNAFIAESVGIKMYGELVEKLGGNFANAAAAYNEGETNFRKYGITAGENANHVKKFNEEFAKGAQDSIASAQQVLALSNQQTQAAQQQQSQLAALNRFAMLEKAQYEQSIEQLKLRYVELTGTAEQAFLAQQKLNFATLEKKAEANNDTGALKLISDTKQAEFERFNLENADAYQQRLLAITQSTKEMGMTSAEAFDVIHGGLGDVARSFDSFASSLDKINQSMAENAREAKSDAKDTSLTAEQRSGLAVAHANKQIALEHKKTQATLAGYGQIAGAAKDLFDEQSSGYKALQAVEQAFRAFEIADAVLSYDTQGGLMQAFTELFMTGKQAEQAADATATGQAVAQSQIRGQAKATEAVATQASAGPYIGFALMAAMAVAMAALGFNTGASSSASLSESRQETQGTGTVFGDAEAKSESISKAIETMKDVDLTMLPLTAQMAASLRNIESSLAGLGNLLIQANVANPEVAGLGTSYNAYKYGGAIINAAIGGLFGGPIGAFLGNEFGNALTGVFKTIDPIGSWLGAEIFGKTTASVEDSGLTIPKQSISDLMTNGLFAQQYADIKTETEYVFGLLSDSSMSRQLQTLSGQASDQLTKLMQSIVLSTEAAAGYLTGTPDAIKQQVANVVLDIGDISLKNLNGDELTDALNHVFSKAADDIAAQAFNELVPFQRVGEGYFETLVRVASGVEQASVSLQALNVPAIEYSNVINKQGDVFAELVRQSLVAVESLDGAANGVGQIITALDASGQDLLATYQSLVEVRNLMIASGINGSVLDASVIGGAGGLDPLKSALSTYQDAYFSEQEQLAAHTREMITAFAALNFVMPDSRAGFRDLVDGLDTSTAAGKVLLGQVLQLAEGFDTLQSQYESVLTSLEDNVTSAYDTASELLQNQIDMFSQYAKSLREFSDTLFNGQLSTATPEDKYRTAKGDFNAIQRVLTSGTAAQKADALPELQGVVQQFLDNSRAFNGGSLTYMRDLAAAQALLGQSINYADGQKDVATQQLTALTQQLTALGLIKTSVDDVTTAVNAVGIALAGLDAFKAAQDQSKVKTANEAAFDKIESTRKQAYEATIADKAGVIGTSAARYEGMVGFSAGTSKNPFSAAGTVDVSTGAATSDVVTTSGGHYAGDIASSLQSDIFPRVAGSLKLVATKLQSMLGGVLPSVALKFGDDEAYGPGYYEYAFADITRRVNSDQIALMERAFANDVTDYLADQLTNTAWIDAVKSVEFSSLGSGFTALAATLAKLKDPFQAGQYDPTIDYTTKLDGLKTFAMGGIATTASIFGEAGPEAAVPLPDGRTIPVTFTGLPDWLISPPGQRQNSSAGGSDDGALLKALQDVQRELAELRKLAESQNKHAAASVAVQQAGYQQMIANLESQVAALGEQVRATRIKADAA